MMIVKNDSNDDNESDDNGIYDNKNNLNNHYNSSCEMLHNDDEYCIMAFCCALSYPTLTLQNLIISCLIRMMKMITI
jgi:hypothetical protein